jgi:hypothetical protein
MPYFQTALMSFAVQLNESLKTLLFDAFYEVTFEFKKVVISLLSGRAVSRRSHHHILRRGGASANPTGSPSAGGDPAGRADEDLPQSRNPATFEEKVNLNDS